MQETRVSSLDPLEKGIAYPLQNSCLENSMDRGAWRAVVHGGSQELDMIEELGSLNNRDVFLTVTEAGSP